jgi:YbbR domain-containing protein
MGRLYPILWVRIWLSEVLCLHYYNQAKARGAISQIIFHTKELTVVLERIKVGLGKRKVKVFLIFLALSALAWFVNNLSFTYVSEANFNLGYTNVPQDFRLSEVPKKTVKVTLRAVGFQFLGFALRKQNVEIDLSKIKKKGAKFYIAPNVYRRQIENQLTSSMEVLDMDRDTLFFDLTKVISKEVPVEARIKYTLDNNYALEDSIAITPKTIIVKGPKSEIDTIDVVQTTLLELGYLKNGFEQSLSLVKPSGLQHTSFSVQKVTVAADVYKFSEKVIKVPVTTINLPKDIEIRTFPEAIEVLCQGTIAVLKDLDSDAFVVEANYAQTKDAKQNMLPVSLKKYPTTLISATLLTDEVEFILRKK